MRFFVLGLVTNFCRRYRKKAQVKRFFFRGVDELQARQSLRALVVGRVDQGGVETSVLFCFGRRDAYVLACRLASPGLSESADVHTRYEAG